MTSLILRNSRPLRNRKTWSTFDDFDSFVDGFFNSYYSNKPDETLASVPVELIEKDNDIIFRAMLPGLKKDDIEIEVTENDVTISGTYKNNYEDNNNLIYRSEFFEGSFNRKISMPQKINHQKAKAEYKDGILSITMPKSEKEMNKVVKLSL